ncbi:MAG: HAD-IA family hydrolase [Candidatus Bathyarchaeota archaeon]|nr:MAG: HAD-IA family hydrolase [Candidatus Bathyarchaeota archaeon]
MKRSRRGIEAVLFDLGGTLIKTTEIPHVMKIILENRGVHRSLKEITAAWKEAEKRLNFRDLTTLLDEFWVQWNQRILDNLHVGIDARELAEFAAGHWWDYSNVTLYPDAEKMLPLLKAEGLKLGVVTNGLQSDVNGILPKVDLQDFFDVVVVIDTLRKMKPDPEVFLYALEKLKIAASDAIFIGDEMDADYRGAQGAGLTVYLIDRDDKVHGKHVRRLSSLEDLLDTHFSHLC